MSGVNTATRVATNGLSGYAQLSDGTIRSWGSNSNGQLGDGTTSNRTVPTTLVGAANATLTDSSYSLGTFLVR